MTREELEQENARLRELLETADEWLAGVLIVQAGGEFNYTGDVRVIRMQIKKALAQPEGKQRKNPKEELRAKEIAQAYEDAWGQEDY